MKRATRLKPSQTEIRRYMDITAALDLLLNKHLVLLNPKSWDDKNDSFFLEAYRQRKALKSVRAACFSTKPETYHHWKCFAPGASGACVIFYKERLLKYVDSHPDLIGGLVKYKTNPQLQGMQTLADADLPFLKRWPYQDEGEYRAIYEDDLWESENAHGISLPLNTIKRVVVSPWCPQSLYLSLKRIIQSLDDCSQIRVHRSLLVDTEMWKDALTAIHNRAFAPTEQDGTSDSQT